MITVILLSQFACHLPHRAHSAVYSFRFLLTTNGRTPRAGECSLSIIQPRENRCVKFKKQTRYVLLRKKTPYDIPFQTPSLTFTHHLFHESGWFFLYLGCCLASVVLHSLSLTGGYRQSGAGSPPGFLPRFRVEKDGCF